MDKEERKARNAIVSLIKTIEAKSLPVNTSAQKAKLIALTHVLQLAKGLKMNIYTDSSYLSWCCVPMEQFEKKGDYI